MFKVIGIVSQIDGTKKLDTKTGQFKKGVRIFVQSPTAVIQVSGSLDDYKKFPAVKGQAYEFPVQVLPSSRPSSMPLFWLNGKPKEIPLSDLVSEGEEVVTIEQLLNETADDGLDVQEEVDKLSAPRGLDSIPAVETPGSGRNGTAKKSATDDLIASVVK